MSGSYDIPGDSMILSYYDIRTAAQGGPGLSDNYFTIINEDIDEWYQMHVRVRTGQCSVELLDFDVLLSPNDVFTFDLYQDAEGDTVFASCDTHTLTASQFAVDSNGCFILDTGTFPNMLSLIQTCGSCPDGTDAPLSASSALEATRWGYVEVIGELELCASDALTPDCQGSTSATECTTEQLGAGEYNAWTFWLEEDSDPGTDCSDYADTSDPGEDLYGKLYYATFDAGRNLVELATANAFTSVWVSGGNDDHNIIHRPCYSDNSPGCNPGDGELENDNPTVYQGQGNPKFAYDMARTSVSSSQGATDINYCFWKGTIGTDSVENQLGAGATFGPTQADLHGCPWCDFPFIGPFQPFPSNGRDGDWQTTADIIGALNFQAMKDDATSHYFYIPGQGQTRFVFTFPFQHFLNQEIEIVKGKRFDTEENECTLPGQKFISPGLPTPSALAGEVTILTAHNSNDGCDYNEGWLEYEFEIVDDGPGWTDGFDPGVLGLVVHWGDNSTADVFDVSPVQWEFFFSPLLGG
jgi:hypothetical protein